MERSVALDSAPRVPTDVADAALRRDRVLGGTAVAPSLVRFTVSNPSTNSGTIAGMDARSGPGLNDPFEEAIDDALSSLPADLRAAMSNVEIVVEDEPPDGQPLLGLYRGVPLPRRSSTYSGVLPDKISIFGGPITRLAAGDADRLRREVRHVVLHEIAHHFGISDERLIELDRY
ncbi:MAG: hypothetical protein JWQ31_2734 [Mycobacterium sp.]|nr:hypothetical protein [Mycobacterium sp.]